PGINGIDFGVNDLATARQPDRHEVVTHVLGTSFTYVSGLDRGTLVAGDRYMAKPTIVEALFSYRRAA
ncbi:MULTISPECIES: hypothetical protein, partial [unclassified Bradyrhizobium]|uniref:hypothetical protein n=1 Tax=unclassified Bradyrhizobium TaxID=2631580 RepID=UPI001FFC0A83